MSTTLRGATKGVTLVRVVCERGANGWYFGTSPDLKGLLVVKPTKEEVAAAVPAAIEDLYAACDAKVIVEKVENKIDHEEGWIAMPAEVAKAALAKNRAPA